MCSRMGTGMENQGELTNRQQKRKNSLQTCWPYYLCLQRWFLTKLFTLVHTVHPCLSKTLWPPGRIKEQFRHPDSWSLVVRCMTISFLEAKDKSAWYYLQSRAIIMDSCLNCSFSLDSVLGRIHCQRQVRESSSDWQLEFYWYNGMHKTPTVITIQQRCWNGCTHMCIMKNDVIPVASYCPAKWSLDKRGCITRMYCTGLVTILSHRNLYNLVVGGYIRKYRISSASCISTMSLLAKETGPALLIVNVSL